jgi:hypothetical protein
MVQDPVRLQKLLDVVVRPIAEAVEASPYKHRMIAWDMINEPEWAMYGDNMYGGEPFGPTVEQPISHAEMEGFLNQMASVLRAGNPGALVTVGQAAIKWASAFTHTAIDFYQLHYYDWVYEAFPYTTWTLGYARLTDKPVVMGEFPEPGLSDMGPGRPARTESQLAQDLWDYGYAGALSWAYHDPSYPWGVSDLQVFAASHPCETKY